MLRFNDIPAIGLGTYGRTGEEGLGAILAALEIGYRHIDTAQTYDTEANVGEAFRRSGLPRGEVFITTKVARVKLARRDFLPSLRASLDALRLDMVDLALIHWPRPTRASDSRIMWNRSAWRSGSGWRARSACRIFQIRSLSAPWPCSERVRSPPIRLRCIRSCRTEKCWNAAEGTVWR